MLRLRGGRWGSGGRVRAGAICILGLCGTAMGAGPQGLGGTIHPEIETAVHAEGGGGFSLRVGGLGVVRRSTVRAENVRAARVPGSAAVTMTWDEAGVTRYALSRDGATIASEGIADHAIKLASGAFVPGARVEPPAHLAASDGAALRIIQFRTPVLPEYRAALEQAGATVRYYLPEQAQLATMDEAARARVEALPFVRWVGAYHPADKLEQPLRAALAADASSLPARQRYGIQVAARGPDMKGELAGSIMALGATIDSNSPHSFILEATLSPEQLLQVAGMDEVVAIDRVLPAAEYMSIVRDVGGANYVESVAGFRGEGVRGEVMDGNVLTTHQDFQARPVILHGASSGSASHGTATYGIVFGTGTANPGGRGMLPMAQGIFADFGALGDRYAHNQRLVTQYDAVFQSNSWGSCCFYSYTTAAAAMDDNIFDNQLLLVQAMANQGSTSSDTIAFAKNIVSVGGIRHQNTTSLTDDAWANAGSIGPAPDGRIKPDLAFWYDSIFTTSSSSTTSYTSSFGGTSAATPMTAGHFGLMFQMWHSGIFGNTVDPMGTVFSNRAHVATAKALMINTATPYAFTGPSADLTRTHQGWGRADVRRLYDARQRLFVIDESRVLAPFETVTYMLEVPAGTPDFRATLVWTDPAGVAASAVNRVNDLHLKVIAPDGATTYWGNNGLRNGNVSTAGGAANTLDTVENVWLTNPAAGVWTVEVSAALIAQDGHIETPETDADFALVVSGVLPQPVTPACPGDADGDGLVGLPDLAVVIEQWFTVGQPGVLGDLNGDGVRDLADIAQVIENWGGECA